MTQGLRIGIIGAGVIGLAAGLWCQRAGLGAVTILDRKDPGTGASYGNAGVFADFARVPYANWGQLKQLPLALLDSESGITVRAGYASKLLSYGLGFLKACSSSGFQAGCHALTQLQSTAADDDRVLLEWTGATSLVRQTGVLALSSSDKALKRALAGSLGLRARLGARAQPVNADEAACLEPALGRFHAGGVYYPDSRFAVSPDALCKRYADRFASQGGCIMRADIKALKALEHSCELVTADGRHIFDHVIVCAGVAGAELARSLGVRLPVVSERGYHLMLEAEGLELRRPVAWLEKSVYLTPMRGGIRVAGAAEFTSPDDPPSDHQIKLLAKAASTMLGRHMRVSSTWVGARPSTPDSLPFIGRISDKPRVSLALGHGHLGLTFSSVTGRMIAESLAAGRDTAEMAPFSPMRFT